MSFRPLVFATCLAVLPTGLACLSAWGQDARPRFVAPIVSPEVSGEREITFRIRATDSKTVRVTGNDLPEIGQGLAMTRSEQGVWETKVGPVQPGTYRYRFEVDGVAVNDPSSSAVSESNGNAWSLVHVPGAPWMDTNQVPHGAIAEITYFSESLNRFRRMHVYTPPGYESDQQQDYPVFFLLHGAFDCDDSWSTVGRAGFILDNLIANGHAEKMIVVMPAGHTGPFQMRPGGSAEDEFSKDFTNDIVPYIESHYRVKSGREHRALAGLSMGGAQTLNIAISQLDQFAYVGVFSSGVFGITGRGPGNPGGDSNRPTWEQVHQEALDNADLKQGLKLVWFATGEDDFLLDTSRATVDLLKQHQFEVTYRETDGGHTWIKWREYLHEFCQYLFRDGVTPVPLNHDLSNASPIIGKWGSTFETQIGTQSYVFDFQPRDDGFGGTATAEINGESFRSELSEGTLEDRKIEFVEQLSFQGNDLRIEYSGVLAEDQLQLQRKVGEIATEELVAKRVAKQTESAGETSQQQGRNANRERRSRRPMTERSSESLPVTAQSPPQGFDQPQDASPKGQVATVEYDSKTVGIRRKLVIYTPPQYNQDNLMDISHRFHQDLTQMNIPHVWEVYAGGHDFNVWRSNLYDFSQRLFR